MTIEAPAPYRRVVARLVGFFALAVTAALAGAAPAAASCLASTPDEQIARADVIFDGVALEGPTASGRQRFRVRRYVKGDGPEVVRVVTGVTRRADGSGSVTSVSLDVAAGEGWRIFGERNSRDVIGSSACTGSRRLTREELRATGTVETQDRGRTELAVGAMVALVALAGVALIVRRRRGQERS